MESRRETSDARPRAAAADEERLEQLRCEIAVGVEQADRGELAPLNMGEIKAKARRRYEARRKVGTDPEST